MPSDRNRTALDGRGIEAEDQAAKARPLVLCLVGAIVIAAAGLGAAAYGLAAAITLLDILGRRIGFAVPGVVDIVQLCTLGGAWLVIPYAFWTDSHVRVDLFVEWLPRRIRVFCGPLALGLTLLLLAPMASEAFAAFQLQQRFGDRSQQIGIPIIWYWLPLLFGLALSILVILIQLLSGRPKEARP